MSVPVERSAPGERGRRGATPGLGRETVLVVDDDPAVLRVVSRALSRGGYRVLEATSGPEALEIAESQREEIHLLLTDVVMPGMGGGEVGERVAARCPGTRILFMSAQVEPGGVFPGDPAAQVNFISKPFTVQGLRARVRAVLDGQVH